tara:strand:+ start:428 stop:901 length:474 start_codon:yes stop_codon:yes gene_type:complete
MKAKFSERKSVQEVEEGKILQPKFDDNNLIPVITIDDSTKEVLMHGYMNPEALNSSLETGQAHYWSRSRQCVWKKGETSGLKQIIRRILIDDDQDCLILSVELLGLKASCHVGYKSCFYRKLLSKDLKYTHNLEFTEKEKVFDPKEIYGDTPNPTKL